MASRKNGSKSRKSKKPQRLRRMPPARTPLVTGGVLANRYEELMNLKPKPADGEQVEDLAVFARVARDQLPSPMQLEAGAVSQALDLVAKGDYQAGLDAVKGIARSSPYAEWRLFLRGLVAFYQNEVETARENWRRLTPQRRPARIAAVLLISEGAPRLFEEGPQPAQRIVEVATELRTRSALFAEAAQIATTIQSNKRGAITLLHSRAIADFYENFRRVDAEFVLAFCQACVSLAYSQDEQESVALLKKRIPGPAHDPGWNLQDFLYFTQFADTLEMQRESADLYVNRDLPRIERITKELAGALGSTIRLMQAQSTVEQESKKNVFGFLMGEIDISAAQALIQQSISLYPNRDAYHLQVGLAESALLQFERYVTRNNDIQKDQLERAVIAAKAELVAAFPDEVDHILWLIDRYFEDDRCDAAKSLIAKLDGQRLDDPRARALPWKQQLLESMHLSKRKSNLKKSGEALDAAEQLWPTWLSKEWLPYLRSALALRSGDKLEFERLHAEAVQASGGESLATDMMTFAALQQMNVVSEAVKPWRQRLENHLKQAIATDALLKLGAFCWDVVRTGIRFRGYALQVTKFGKALCQQFQEGNCELSDSLRTACHWAGSHHFWNSHPSGYKVPSAIVELAQEDTHIAIACYRSLIERPHYATLVELGPRVEQLAAEAKLERDPFYRHHFESTSQRLQKLVADRIKMEQGRYGFSRNAFDDDDDIDIDDEDEDGFEDEFDDGLDNELEAPTPPNRSQERGNQKSSAQSPSTSFADLDFGFGDWDEEDEDEVDLAEARNSLSPERMGLMLELAVLLGNDGLQKFLRIMRADGKPNRERVNQAAELCRSYGASQEFAEQLKLSLTGGMD